MAIFSGAKSRITPSLKTGELGMATQLDDASHVVVILANKHMRYDSEDFRANLARRGLTEEQMQANMATYQRFQTEHINVLENDRTLFDWASKQTYIALANMMTGAALIGIDSCPIEGFNYAEVNRILAQTGAYDAEKYAVSVAVTFGYRTKEIRPKSRKPLNEICSLDRIIFSQIRALLLWLKRADFLRFGD